MTGLSEEPMVTGFPYQAGQSGFFISVLAGPSSTVIYKDKIERPVSAGRFSGVPGMGVTIG